jgi:uncharacterized repeat protein (TIGR01451 family)
VATISIHRSRRRAHARAAILLAVALISGALVAGHVARAAADPSTAWLWVHQFGSNQGAGGEAVAVDVSGDSYVTGGSDGTMAGAPEGSGGAFVAKYDAAGDRLWLSVLGSAGDDDAGMGIAVDASGNSYVTGYTMGTLPGSPDTNAGGQDVFVAKYDTAGDQLWVHQFGSALDDVGNAIAVDTSGNSYLAGQTDGALPGAPEPPAGNLDAFVAKYDTAGILLWVHQLGSSEHDVGQGIAVDASGDSYTAGWTQGTLPGSPESGGEDAFVAKFDSTGTLLWVHQLGPDAVGKGIGVDASGNIYVAGDGSALPGSTGTGFGFVAKYDSAGNRLWVDQSGSAKEEVWAVAVDRSGNSYVTGWVVGTERGSPEMSAGNEDLFVAKRDTAGHLLSVHQLGSTSYDVGYGIAVDAFGNTYVTGTANGRLLGAPEEYTGTLEAFVAKLAAPTADLSIVSSSSASVRADKTVVAHLVMTNNGPDAATGVTLDDSFPLSVQPVSATTSQGTCTLGRPVTCALGTLKTAKSAKVSVTLRPILPGSATATATVSSEVSDPNAADNSATMNMSVLAAAKTKYVTVDDNSMSPAALKVALGTTVQWDFLGTANHDVTDSTGMGLYASGSEAPGVYYAYAFTGAGIYAYTSAEDTPGFGGTVTVAPTITPTAGTTATAFALTWATTPPPTGYAFDVQIQRPTGGYTNYVTGTADQAAEFTPDAGTGTYRFRVRLRHTADNTAGQYATAKPVTVT